MGKYLDRILGEPGILIFKEKHGTRYFVCQNKEDFLKAAKKVLKERIDDDYWYYDADEEEIEDQELNEYYGLPKSRLEMEKTRAIQALNSQDPEEAYNFLEYRSNGEYEGMRLEKGEEY